VARSLPELVQYREELQRLDHTAQDRELLWVFARRGHAGSNADELAEHEGGPGASAGSEIAKQEDEVSQATSKTDSGSCDEVGSAGDKSDTCPSVDTSASAPWHIRLVDMKPLLHLSP
jgi:hypothetical protein